MLESILLIATIVCFVISSGAVDSFKRALWRWLKGSAPYREYSLKPLDCELCLTWWCGLLYIIVTGNLTLANIALVAIVAWSTPVIVELLNLLVDIPRRLIDMARSWLKL